MPIVCLLICKTDNTQIQLASDNGVSTVYEKLLNNNMRILQFQNTHHLSDQNTPAFNCHINMQFKGTRGFLKLLKHTTCGCNTNRKRLSVIVRIL